MSTKSYKDDIKAEKQAFDNQAREREKLGLYPDVRELRVVEGLYNNPWREPEFFNLQILPRIEFIISSLSGRKGKVLEIGCGSGFLSLEIARNGMEVLGIDLSSTAIDIAKATAEKNRYPDGFGSLQYRVMDFTTAEMEKGSWDSIVFMGSLHHFPEIPKVLEKVANLLKPSGNLVLCEPISENFNRISAEQAALLRLVCPTWETYEEKLSRVSDAEGWEQYVTSIMHEYQYVDEKGKNVQSPMDNSASTEEIIMSALNQYFTIQRYVQADSFIDKLIGGLRGPDRMIIAKFLKFYDDYVVEKHKLPYTGIRIHAVKK